MASTTLGAIPSSDGVTFRVWAPSPGEVRLLLSDAAGERTVRPLRDDDGYWIHDAPGAGPGLRYGYLLDGSGPFPDPCSRWQPDGVRGLSCVAGVRAPARPDWRAPAFEDLVVYEAHIGTLTPGGTFRSAVGELDRLASLGINAIEVMPVASFAGRWNWGYDGVALWAPFEGYGGPAGLREFVAAAHARGIAVILDVVYNHFGPDGNYSGLYSSQYYRADRHTPWGDAINFDGEGSGHVRRFFIENAIHWLEEYGIDGLRLDATHAILDESEPHFVAELTAAVRKAIDRPVYVIAETHENDARYVKPPDAGGFGLDALWADDFHHGARTSVAGDRDAYFAGFEGLPSLARVVERGWLYEGQFDPGYGAARGGPTDFPGWPNLVFCLQNHDQVGNRAMGERLAAIAGEPVMRALTALLLLHPATPMLFQGQEFGSKAPFLYFTDHHEHLGAAIREGRRAEFAKFRAFSDPHLRELIPDPQSERTFQLSRLEGAGARDPRAPLIEAFHRELIQLRASDAVLRRFRAARLPIAASQRREVLTVRFVAGDSERLLLLNLGGGPEEIELPRPGNWRCLFSSDEPAFGGFGAAVAVGPGTASMPARSAAFLARDR